LEMKKWGPTNGDGLSAWSGILGEGRRNELVKGVIKEKVVGPFTFSQPLPKEKEGDKRRNL